MSTNSRLNLIIAAFIFVLAFAVYLPSLDNQFVWDDISVIAKNPYIRSFEPMWRFFTPDFWNNRLPIVRGAYRPILMISLMVDYAVWGINPFGYHLANILLHAANAVLVFLLVGRLWRDKRAAVLAGLLFAVHAAPAEAVLWTKNRGELLSLFFMLLAFLWFCDIFINSRSTRRTSPGALIVGSVIFLLLSLLSKETAVVMPVLLTLFAWRVMRDTGKARAFLWTIPHWCVVLVYLAVRSAVIAERSVPDVVQNTIGLWQNILIVPKTIGCYIGLLFFPVGLSADHEFTVPNHLSELTTLLPVIGLVIVLVVLIRLRKSGACFAILWMLAALLPVANIKYLYGRPFAEQRLYLPAVGFCMLIGCMWSATFNSKGDVCRSRRIAASVPAILLVGVLAVVTIFREPVWQESITLWADTVKRSPGAMRPYNNFGNALKDRELLHEAAEQYRSAIRVAPHQSRGFSNLGVIHYRLGELEEAKNLAEQALQRSPVLAESHDLLGIIFTEQGEFEKAEREFEQSLAIDFTLPKTHKNLGRLRELQGRTDEAIKEYQTALKADAEYAMAFYDLGSLYLTNGDLVKAVTYLATAVRLEPTAPTFRVNYGIALYSVSQVGQAKRQFREAIRLDSALWQAHFHLGIIYLSEENLKEAKAELIRAKELTKNPEAVSRIDEIISSLR